MTLDPAFFAAPIAHRGFHDVADGRPENSFEAAEAAIASGYGIELDVQLTADGQATVFHDYSLNRLTGTDGYVRTLTAEELAKRPLIGGTKPIPTLPDFLALVAGRVPLLLEIKDQSLKMTDDIGPLEEAAAKAIADYQGPLAVMSFNPHSVARMAKLAPNTPRGLVTDPYQAEDWGFLTNDRRAQLAQIPDYGPTGASFISHLESDLAAPRVAELKSQGAAIFCWTIKSQTAATRAAQYADNITFEGFTPLSHP